MGTLHIQLFGTLRVQRTGQPVLQFPTRRVKDLFSLLLLSPHTLHSREVLADALWGDGEERDPRHCLNTALWRLRRVLGEPEPGEHPYLRVDAQHIGFNTTSDCRIDIAEFESRCMWADQLGAASPVERADFYRQAVDLYRADLLVDCYADWCLTERDRLQRMYLRALDFLVEHHAVRHEYAAATEFATRLLACDPLREDIHQRLIRFYLETMQPALALRQYQACETVLRRELGAIPTPETRAIVQPIFIGRSAPDMPVTVSAPPPAAPIPPLADSDLPDLLQRLNQAVNVVEALRAELNTAASTVQACLQQLTQQLRPPSEGGLALTGPGAAAPPLVPLTRGVETVDYTTAYAPAV